MAQHFYDILKNQNNFDLYREYSKLRNMFYSKKIILDNPYPGETTIFFVIDKNFKNVKFNDGSFESLWEFEQQNKLTFRMEQTPPSKDYYLFFCEYLINLLNNFDISDKEFKSYCTDLKNYILKSISKLNYIESKKEDTIIFIPKDELTIEVAAKVEPSLKEKILNYRHHSLNGKLDKKRDVLNSLALELEPKRNILSSLASNMTSDLFAAFNNFSIRHNNSDPSDSGKYNEKFTNLSDTEKEELYDFVFQYCLIALKLLDNKRCKDLIERYK